MQKTLSEEQVRHIKDVGTIQSHQKPEWEFYDSCVDKPIKITLLNGKIVAGTLLVWSTYALIIQEKPSEFPVLYFKHAIQSVER